MPLEQRPVPPAQKPFTPALSSNFRSTKSPLTPRLAGSATSSPSILPRRDLVTRAVSPAREKQTGASTPGNGNITPRSGARRSRPGTESPATPAAKKDASSRPRAITTATATKPTPFPQQTPQHPQHGLGITSPRTEKLDRPKLNGHALTSPTPVYTLQRRTSTSRLSPESEDELSSKFMRANDAKSSSISQAKSADISKSPEHDSFSYAGDYRIQGSTTSPRQTVARSNSLAEEKFFRADDIPNSASKTTRPGLQHKKSFASSLSTKSQPATQRPSGPIHSQTSPVRSGRPLSMQPSPPKPRSIIESAPPVDSPLSAQLVRRRSIGSNSSSMKVLGHRKSMSTSSLQKITVSTTASPLSPTKLKSQPSQLATQRDMDTSEPVLGPLISPSTLSARSTSLASTTTFPTSRTSDTDHSDTPPARKPSRADSVPFVAPSFETAMRSPQAPPQQRPPPEGSAANARRERKVLDLEISNSSLLAINKTLEKELRKQSTELRRFRRLSRSGRLSILPAGRASSGTTLDPLAETENEMDDDMSDFDADSDLDLLDEDDDGSILSGDSNSVMSPTSKTRQRIRDEKRLMLDLSKHQQLLIDSQKLSQSIKHCTTRTEELIREGEKALQYRVGIGDLKLGGRVLSHDDLEDSGTESGTNTKNLVMGGGRRRASQGLLSPSLTKMELMEATQWISNGPGSMQSLDGSEEKDAARLR